MSPNLQIQFRPRSVLIGAALAAMLATPAFAAPLFDPMLPPSAIGEPVQVAQNNQQAAQLAVRIQQLEEQIRVLTGQVEGLTFQLTQMQVMIQKMQEDNEYRFQELEGGAPAGAAGQSGALTSPQAPMPDPNAVAVADPSIVTLDQTFQSPSTSTVTTNDPSFGAPMDNIGDSLDPMIGAGDAGAGTLGTLQEGDVANLGGQPLDLSLDGAPQVNPDADAQYAAGYDALVRGEAVVENLEIKHKIFAAAEARLKPGAILATNTSSIELERIAEGLKEPGRLIGLHFFNPVAQLPLVEVIRSTFNSDAEVAKGASFALAIGKSPVVAKSAPGFLVNRVLMPYMLGAVERVERGESKEVIDAAAVAFGMPMGPIELMDTVGLDVGASVAKELGHDVPLTSQFAKLVTEGKLGRKAGQGFYTWEGGKAVKAPAPEHADLAGLGRELVKPLADMTEVVVADGVVASADLADIGVILGTGFAPFLGGPMKARRDGKV